MFDRILVAVDPDELNAALVDKAIDLAAATGAEIKFISLLTTYGEGAPPMFAYPGLTGYPPGIEDSVWQDYQKRYEAYRTRSSNNLQRFKTKAQAAGISADTVQFLDSPGRAICDAAEQWKADLVMVGSRGRKGLSEIFLGSVSNYVMHHAACSVMIVQGQAEEQEDAQAAAAASEKVAV